MKVKFAVLVAVTTILVSGAVSATPASAAGAGCVRLYDSYQGRNGQSGQTYMSWNGTTKHLNTVTIRFDDSYALSSRMARQAVQHELGHSFGTTYHARSLSTCMYYRLSNAANPLPAAADKRLLNAIY